MSDLIVTGSVSAPRRHGRSGWDHLVAAVRRALRTSATRPALPELPDHLLADIGISRDAALAEAARLPWDSRPARRWRRASGPWCALQHRLEEARVRRLLVRDRLTEVFWGG